MFRSVRCIGEDQSYAEADAWDVYVEREEGTVGLVAPPSTDEETRSIGVAFDDGDDGDEAIDEEDSEAAGKDE